MRYTFLHCIRDNIANWLHNDVVEPLSRYHDKHKKTHYECCVCGILEAPHFDGHPYGSMRYDYGWHKFADSKRWICHNCADHNFAPSSEKDIPIESGTRDYTWDEWQDYVIKYRTHIREMIKAKDPEYYNKCYFYDDEESVERYWSQFEYEDDE